ncbi:Hypothetical protein NTJ_10695 [Nesidiocoris tenuis]|uniref:Uncharacterized protein n=1 Tax=Nesidiocoris tenuis TaxID=355587 RepID=A0ABN7B0E7_9HEMI|nr:Hypothetical protein NTJ_10695 [Nesidiocoris tenuis]
MSRNFTPDKCLRTSRINLARRICDSSKAHDLRRTSAENRKQKLVLASWSVRKHGEEKKRKKQARVSGFIGKLDPYAIRFPLGSTSDILPAPGTLLLCVFLTNINIHRTDPPVPFSLSTWEFILPSEFSSLGRTRNSPLIYARPAREKSEPCTVAIPVKTLGLPADL